MSAQNANVTQNSGARDGEHESDDDAAQDAENETQQQLSLDVVFEILKNERRRSVLQYLQGNEDRVVLGELAEHIAAHENDTTVESLTAQQRKRVYVGLYQCHLPKMDDAGIVEFDRNRGVVELSENAEQLEEYLETDAEVDRPWPSYYLGIALTGGVLVLAGQLGAYPVGWLGDVAILGVLAAVVGCATLQDRLTADDD